MRLIPLLLLAAAAPFAGSAAEAPAIRFIGPVAQGALVRGVAPAGTISITLDDRPVAFAADGRFILGLDRDAPRLARLLVRLADGREVDQAVAVAPRRWPIEHVGMARRPGGASLTWLRMREGELARIAAARALDPPSEGWRQAFAWPARGRISGRFGAQRVYRGEPAAYHSGVDVAAGAGAPVFAPADGVVVLAGPPAFSLEGNLVIVAHGMGLSSAFLHLSRVDVRPGQRVVRGQAIGAVGRTGRATGPHLHWGMKWQAARIDPQALAGPMPPPS